MTHVAPPELAEAIEVAKIWKSRRRDIAIVISLAPFEGKTIFDIRQHAIGSDGCMRPTQKGLALVVRRLPEIAEAIGKALTVARARGLIPADDGGER
jgi:hypothetical protein